MEASTRIPLIHQLLICEDEVEVERAFNHVVVWETCVVSLRLGGPGVIFMIPPNLLILFSTWV